MGWTFYNASGQQLRNTGTVLATQAEMEAGSSTAAFVTPGRTHFHPGVAKMWVSFQADTTIDDDYGVTDITDNAVGTWTVNTDVDWSAADSGAYSVNLRMDERTGTAATIGQIASFISTGVQVQTIDYTDGTLTDAARISVIGFGDFA